MVAPMVIGATSFALDTVRVYFSDPVSGTGTSTNFNIPGLSILSSTPSADTTYADIVTSGMTRGSIYTVTVSSPPVVDGLSQTLSVVTADFYGATAPSDMVQVIAENATKLQSARTFDGLVSPADIIETKKISAAEALFYALQNKTTIIRKYAMRAQKISDSTFVWWVSDNNPDLTGIYSGVPIVDLTDIVIESSFDEIVD